MSPSEVSGPDHRLHASSLLFNLTGEVKAFLLPFAALLFSGGSQVVFWLTVPAFVIGLAVAVGRYLTFTYRYGESELIIRSGLFFKQERHIPYSRIQNIDARQNLFHRAFDVQVVVLETAAGGTPEAVISVLPDAAVTEMRRRIFAQPRVQAADETSSDVAREEQAETLLQLPLRELVIAGLVRGRGWIVIAAATGLLSELGILERYIDRVFDDEKAVESVGRTVFGRASAVQAEVLLAVALVAATFLVLALLLRLLSVIATIERLYDFTLKHSGDELLMTYGLLTRVRGALPLRRIQTLTVREGPLHRWFGRSSLRADTAGGEIIPQAKGGREWLAPIATPPVVASLAARFMPGVDFTGVNWKPVHARAVRRIFVRMLMPIAALAAFLFWSRGFAGVPIVAVLLALAALHARRSVRYMRFAIAGDLVLYTSGWVWRHTTVAPLAKVQAVVVRQSPFDRRHQMARLVLDTAGAEGAPHRLDMRYLKLQDAHALAEIAAGRAAASAFSW